MAAASSSLQLSGLLEHILRAHPDSGYKCFMLEKPLPCYFVDLFFGFETESYYVSQASS